MLKQLTIAIVLVALPSLALAQEHSAHGVGDSGPPAICTANAGAHGDMPMGGTPMGGDAAHVDLMDGMEQMNADMTAGGTATDIDVAFVCSMIPHHRGAIDMAKAELAHGDDPWAKELAAAVIAAQEKEIAEMVVWLEKQK